MPAAAWVTLLGVALVVAALAFYLLRVIAALQHVSFTLGTIVAGVRAIVNQTLSVPPVVANVNRNLEPVHAAVDDLGARFGGGRG